MCGIAGYSLNSASTVGRRLTAQALLAAIAERGADAAGYAHRGDSGPVTVHKQRSGASALLEQVEIPQTATQALLHVRDYTKGHPTIAANNHPVRHGSVVGIHNGIIFNDDELLAAHSIERAEPDMTVDSEAIFAVAEVSGSSPRALEQLRGSMAAAWIDERRDATLYLARGVGRPVWLGEGRDETIFASTLRALEVAERYTGITLRKSELGEGTIAVLARGRIARRERFAPDRRFQEASLPSVRAPGEGDVCLRRLEALAATASL